MNIVKKYIPNVFFDILYQNNSIYEDENINTCFLPNIDFKDLLKEDISDNTRKTIWKYIQLILFSIITNIKTDNCFGNTSKLFEAIDETEFKNKIEETVKQMHNIFESDPTKQTDSSKINLDNLPNPEQIHNHINQLMEGKLGNLAKEIAEDTASSLDIDTSDVNNIGDVFQKLFKDPTKLMGIVKNVGSKLDEKMKSGEIKESELLEEATEMMQRMQSMPGMNNIGDILGKLNLPNMGPGAKFNNNAFESMMSQNLKKAKAKERMKAKLDERKKTENAVPPPASPSQSELETVNANLAELMKQLNVGNIAELATKLDPNNLNLNNTNRSEVSETSENRTSRPRKKKKHKGKGKK